MPYVKTNMPITLLSFESTNDVWGRCTNPHSSKYSPGGSTGGESALLAMGGRIGIGSDVAGSVRVPAHFAGCYSLRCSTGRWPKLGICTSMRGQEGRAERVQPHGANAQRLDVLHEVGRRDGAWKYDYTVHSIPRRAEIEKEYADKPKLKVGVLRTDGVVDPSPACARALELAEAAFRRDGHEVVEISPPDMYEALRLASLLPQRRRDADVLVIHAGQASGTTPALRRCPGWQGSPVRCDICTTSG